MSLAQLRREVNSIQRKLVRELRVVRTRRVAGKYCNLWSDLVARKKLPPNPFRLLKNLRRHTGNPGHFARVDDYLQQCRNRRHLPDPGGILFRLLPEEAEMGLISYGDPDPVKY